MPALLLDLALLVYRIPTVLFQAPLTVLTGLVQRVPGTLIAPLHSLLRRFAFWEPVNNVRLRVIVRVLQQLRIVLALLAKLVEMITYATQNLGSQKAFAPTGFANNASMTLIVRPH